MSLRVSSSVWMIEHARSAAADWTAPAQPAPRDPTLHKHPLQDGRSRREELRQGRV